jgi:hypothetical protein
MELTSGTLSAFNEGMVVIKNKEKEYFARGKVMNLNVKNGQLEIVFLLFAFGWITGRIDFPTMPQEWVLAIDKRFLSWTVDLNNYTPLVFDPPSEEIPTDEEGNFTIVSVDKNYSIQFRPK